MSGYSAPGFLKRKVVLFFLKNYMEYAVVTDMGITI